ncbi:MAG: 30S ribosomal protein S20 [Deltaproteobacteria bacterium]|nr:30S ribosomal protein S20 [Deltaproteobacteria bacterium]
MANHKSAIKRHRQSEKRRVRNASVKSAVRTAIKKVDDAVKAGKAEEAKASLVTAVSEIDRAAIKGVLHRNNASRRISRLTIAVNQRTAK